LSAISDLNDEDMFEIKQQGYLGETSNRGDEIYNGTKGDLSMHLQSQEWFTFKQAINDRARRVKPDLVFNIAVTSFFPNGDTPTVTYPDVNWGPIPTNIPSRGDYVKVKLEWFCSATDVALS
jgi:hypothetical protein